MNEKRSKKILCALGDIDSDFVLDAAPEVGYTKKRKRDPAIIKFLNSTAGVAIICTVISLGAVVGIVMAGQNSPTPPLGNPTGSFEGDSLYEIESPDTLEPEKEDAVNNFFEVTTSNDALSSKTEDDTTKAETEAETHPASDGLAFTSNGDGTCYVSGIGDCKDIDIVIPLKSPIGDTVIAIGESAFQGCSNITSIIIPDSVTSIGSKAFRDCSGLKSVTIPQNVTSIESGVFYNCSSLLDIEIPRGVNAIGDWAFRYCTSLTKVTIPNGVQSIGEWAFYGCKGLTSIAIPNTVKSIGECAFLDCTSLKSLYIPNSVTSIGLRAFNNCSALESITVGRGNFQYYSSGNCLIVKWTKMIILGCKNSTISDDVGGIDSDAFIGCIGLTSITIPDNIRVIEDLAFVGCENLTSVIFENPYGWRTDGIELSGLDDPETAAKYLTDTYTSSWFIK